MLLEFLNKKQFSTDESRGNISVGLGLMEASAAAEILTETIKKSKFRPDLLQQAAIGLGLVFADNPQPLRAQSEQNAVIAARLKENFDPTGRLNPGRDPGQK